MVRLVKRHKLLCFLFLLTAVLHFVPERAAGSLRSAALPVLRVFGTLGTVFDGAAGLVGASGEKETQRLVRENRELRAKLAAEREANRRLRKALGHAGDFAQTFRPSDFRLVSAEVTVRRDASNFRRSVLINRGWRHRVEKGMPVIQGRSLVGVVSAAGHSSSLVQLLVDPAFRIRAALPGGGREGIAEGTGAGDFLLSLKYLDTGAPPERGEPVIASGYRGRFPAGLFIGTVSEVSEKPGGDFHSIRVRPAVDWRTLDVVEVVVMKPDELAEEVGR